MFFAQRAGAEGSTEEIAPSTRPPAVAELAEADAREVRGVGWGM